MDHRCHNIQLVFESKVSGVEQMQVGLGKVAEIGTGFGCRKNFVVLVPHDQRGRLILAKECLKFPDIVACSFRNRGRDRAVLPGYRAYPAELED